MCTSTTTTTERCCYARLMCWIGLLSRAHQGTRVSETSPQSSPQLRIVSVSNLLRICSALGSTPSMVITSICSHHMLPLLYYTLHHVNTKSNNASQNLCSAALWNHRLHSVVKSSTLSNNWRRLVCFIQAPLVH